MSTELYKIASDQANFRAIFENQKEKLLEILEGDLIYPYNGGYFLMNPTLFLEIKMHLEDELTYVSLLDINKNPINIIDLTDFYLTTRTLYKESLNKYKMGLAKIKKAKSVPKLTKSAFRDLDDDVEE